MKKRIPTEELRNREYWTAKDAARVLGRGADFWRAAFDRGDVSGYTRPHFTGVKARYMEAASCRAYLKRLAADPPVKTYKKPHRASAAFLKAISEDPEYAPFLIQPKRRTRRVAQPAPESDE